VRDENSWLSDFPSSKVFAIAWPYVSISPYEWPKS